MSTKVGGNHSRCYTLTTKKLQGVQFSAILKSSFQIHTHVVFKKTVKIQPTNQILLMPLKQRTLG